MDVDTAYKMLNQKFEPIRKELLHLHNSHPEHCAEDVTDTEATTELDGILWAMAQEIAEGKFASATATKSREIVEEVLQSALDWDAEYRAINNLGNGVPHWVDWAKRTLGMVGNYTPVPK